MFNGAPRIWTSKQEILSAIFLILEETVVLCAQRFSQGCSPLDTIRIEGDFFQVNCGYLSVGVKEKGGDTDRGGA